MNESLFWTIRNHMINNLNWDYDYRESFLVRVDAIYEFQYFCAKERFPMLCCKAQIFDAHIMQLEHKVSDEIGAHLTLYQTFRKIILVRLDKENLQSLDVTPPHFPFLNALRFSEQQDKYINIVEVEKHINRVFSELA